MPSFSSVKFSLSFSMQTGPVPPVDRLLFQDFEFIEPLKQTIEAIQE